MGKSGYSVVVGNIGTVCTGDYDECVTAFNEYQDQSIFGSGRASGEDISMFNGEELVAEYSGSNSRSIATDYRIVVTPTSHGYHMKIDRYDGKPIKEGWDFFQNIKNHYIGREVTMVEFFPEESQVVNEINMRHFWTVNIPLPMHP